MKAASTVDALQRTLAAEHAAIFVLGALGGRASSLTAAQLRTAVSAAYDVHVARRDQLRTMVTTAGGDPVAAEPVYRLPRPLASADQIRAEALRIERACVTTYGALVAATAGPTRRWAVEALVATAVGEAAFGGRAEPLPGLDG